MAFNNRPWFLLSCLVCILCYRFRCFWTTGFYLQWLRSRIVGCFAAKCASNCLSCTVSTCSEWDLAYQTAADGFTCECKYDRCSFRFVSYNLLTACFGIKINISCEHLRPTKLHNLVKNVTCRRGPRCQFWWDFLLNDKGLNSKLCLRQITNDRCTPGCTLQPVLTDWVVLAIWFSSIQLKL